MARILLVDDDPDQLEIRKRIVEAAGHEVRTAATKSEAFEKFLGCRLVIMDLHLPELSDGLELIHAVTGSARVIVLSGDDAPAGVQVDEFLLKPCPSRRLLDAVSRLCR